MSSEQDSIFSAADLAGGMQAAESSDFRLPTDRLLCIRPFGYKQVPINGKDVATCEVYAIVVEDKGAYEDLGMRDVNWTPVLRELDKATDESPWIVGTVKHPGRSYFLDSPTPEQFKMAQASLASLLRDRS